MKILEILSTTYRNGGHQVHQIQHQEGWDFRQKQKHEGYVRWVNAFEVDIHYVALRGKNETCDFDIRKGTIDFNKITEFFNSDESPLDLKPSNGKRSIESFNEKDLEDMRNEFGKEYKKSENGCLYRGLCCLACLKKSDTFWYSYATEDESLWLLERFTWKEISKKQVVMTCISNENEPDVLIERRTWTLQ